MKNPFAPAAGDFTLPRNAVDLSFQNLFTTEFGRITPILCQEVIPGDSFKISSAVALQAMPTVFPVQTKVRCSVSYFYCRNRTVYDDFEDFIFKTKDNLVSPYLLMTNERAKRMVSTGSLGDFLGVPTTVGSVGTLYSSFKWETGFFMNTGSINTKWLDAYVNAVNTNYSQLEVSSLSSVSTLPGLSSAFFLPSTPLSMPLNSDFRITFDCRSGHVPTNSPGSALHFALFVYDGDLPDYSTGKLPIELSQFKYGEIAHLTFSGSKAVITPSAEFIDRVNKNIARSGLQTRIFYAYSYIHSSGGTLHFGLSSALNVDGGSNQFSFAPATTASYGLLFTSPVEFSSDVNRIVDSTEDGVIAANPFVGSTPRVRLNALPFRHYEQVMNYYFRNDLNNPYMLNGEPQYNEFIPSHAGGADTNLYDFHYHNWELDKFTSAQQSPQFGLAPLVGLTFAGEKSVDLTFADANDSSKTYRVTVGLDGDRISDIANFDKDIPSANLRMLMDQVNYGISINDFRMTNAFQRFKENVVRRGLRYRNQLKSHFGVDVDYPDIDVPQYIGGYSGLLDVSKITNLADSPNAGLGDFVGQMSGLITGKHDVSVFCPEHGFIIGVMSIVPVPTYSQACKKSLLKTDAFDYYQSEFGKIGFVPMHYSEVMPLQNGANQSPDDVFGYQKAWYDYMSNVDEVHGDFRTNLRDFVMQRLFAERPVLSEDFVRVRPEDVDSVFVTQNIADAYGSSDKFMCNVQHAIVARRPVPIEGTPSLE